MKVFRKELLGELTDFSLKGNGLVLGRAGVGKTHILLRLAEDLLSKGYPALVLRIQSLGEGNDIDIKRELGIKDDSSFIDWVKEKFENSQQVKGVLIFDGYDAARKIETKEKFLSLISKTIIELKDVASVIVSVRNYDASKSQKLLNLFKLEQGDCKNKYNDKSLRCRNFSIPSLSMEEIAQLYPTYPRLEEVINIASSALKDILKIPFNLKLLIKLLQHTEDLTAFSGIYSEIQLLESYWNYRINFDERKEEYESILFNIASEMIKTQDLSVLSRQSYETEFKEAWKQLLSNEILEYSPSQLRINFSHNILFDYAVSKLCLDQELNKFTSQLLEDSKKPFFLIQAIHYYFIELWYKDNSRFWQYYFKLQEHSSSGINLIAQVVLNKVVINEIRSIEEISPLINELKRDNQNAYRWMKDIIILLKANKPGDVVLWLEIILELIKCFSTIYVWELSVAISDFLESDPENTDVVNKSSIAARSLLKWSWENRAVYSWVNDLMSYWLIPVVAKTYSNNPDESKSLLSPILGLINEDNYPVKVLERFCDQVKFIIPNDPAFAEKIYRIIFNYQEEKDESFEMGRAGFIGLMSSKIQEYQMCKYHLDEYYPIFIQTSPLKAFSMGIELLNKIVLDEHINRFRSSQVKLKEIEVEFQFNGEVAKYAPDNSCLWDDGVYLDESPKLSKALFGYLTEISGSNDTENLAAKICLFAKNAQVAFLWRRLLKTASSNVQSFAPILYDLCLAEPILFEADTREAVIEYLKNAKSIYGADKMEKIKNTILDVVEKENDKKVKYSLNCIKNILLEGIFEEKQTVEVSNASRALPQKKNTKEPIAVDPKKIVEDLNKPETLINIIEGFNSKWFYTSPQKEEQIKIHIDDVTKLMDVVKDSSLDQDTKDKGLNAIASFGEVLSRFVKSKDDPYFELAKKILLEASISKLPRYESEREKDYDGSSNPSWISAGRNEAAQGLPRLTRFDQSEEIISSIKKLSIDAVSSVRYLLLRDLRYLLNSAPEIFWGILENRAKFENKKSLIASIISVIGGVGLTHEVKTTGIVNIISEELFKKNDNDAFFEEIIDIAVGLALQTKNSWASDTLNKFIQQPDKYSGVLKYASNCILDRWVCPDNLEVKYLAPPFEEGINWIYKILESTILELKDFIKSVNDKKTLSQEEVSTMRGLYGIIEEIVTRIFFGADTEGYRSKRTGRQVPEAFKKEYYFKVKPLLNHLVTRFKDEGIDLPAPIAHHFIEYLNSALSYDIKDVINMASLVVKLSERANYNLNSLAIKEISELVERVLADYRDEVKDNKSFQDLVDILHIFAKAGWPQAVKVVYNLNEVFR